MPNGVFFDNRIFGRNEKLSDSYETLQIALFLLERNCDLRCGKKRFASHVTRPERGVCRLRSCDGIRSKLGFRENDESYAIVGHIRGGTFRYGVKKNRIKK